MGCERLFLDTSFVVARFYRRDRYHAVANHLMARVESCAQLWTTEAVLLEIGAAFRDPVHRSMVTELWEWFERQPNCRLAPISGSLWQRGVELFGSAPTRRGALPIVSRFW